MSPEKDFYQNILFSKDIAAVRSERGTKTTSLFYPFYSNNSFIIIDVLLLYMLNSGVRCELKLSPKNLRTTRRAPRNICASSAHSRAKNAPATPFLSGLYALVQKSAHLIEKKRYQHACFHTHPHSFPANPLVTSFYIFDTGGGWRGPSEIIPKIGQCSGEPTAGQPSPGLRTMRRAHLTFYDIVRQLKRSLP